MKEHLRRSSHLAATSKVVLQPRKQPVQARSAATVDAILQATIQVLLAGGKEQLTTTQVAVRAGVSVGTLYQYFPNKIALLQACLRRHMDDVSQTIVRTCREQRDKPLLDMALALIDAYLGAKMRDVRTSAALYAVSSDIEGATIAKTTSQRAHRAVAELFATAQERLTKDPDIVASVVIAALNGISRRVLEARSPERALPPLREELVVLIHSYLRACIHTPSA